MGCDYRTYPSERLCVRLTEAHQSGHAVTSIPGSLGGPYDPSSPTVTLCLTLSSGAERSKLLLCSRQAGLSDY